MQSCASILLPLCGAISQSSTKLLLHPALWHCVMTVVFMQALQEGVKPEDLCAKYRAIHKEVYNWFNIDFDYFGRTSTEKQTE